MRILLSCRGSALVLMLLVVCTNALAGTYYIDYANGSDNNAGTSKSAPWKRHPYMNGYTGHYSHSAGDRFIFKGGVTWPAAAFSMNITQGGSASAPDYYGADSSWYAGSAWTRPIFDLQNQVPARSSAAIQVNASYVTLDSLEIRNLLIRSGSTWQASSISIVYRDHVLIKNCYIHDWTTTSSIDDQMGGVTAVGANNVTVEHSTIHGKLMSGNRTMGACTFNIETVRFSKLYNCSNGVFGSKVVHDNVIHDIGDSYDPDYHENAMEIGGGPVVYVYNNLVYNCNAGTCIYPNPGNGNDVATTIYIYNNVVYNSDIPVVQVDMWGQKSATSSLYVLNNTLHCPGGHCVRIVPPGSNFPLTNLTVRNNHYITDNRTMAECWNNAGGNSTCGRVTNPVTASNNLATSVWDASSLGFTVGNHFAPTSHNSPTVGYGANLTSLCNSAGAALCRDTTNGSTKTANSRPASGAWDAGAYTFAGSGADTSAPSVPVGLSGVAVSPNRIDLSWAPSTDNVKVSGYRVYRDNVLSGTTASVSYSDANRSPNTTYTYTVAAYDAAGNSSARSGPTSIRTPALVDTTPPTIPAGVAATPVSSSEISVSWKPCSDNLGVAGYRVFRNGAQIAAVSGTTFHNSGLSASSTYTYAVSAYDGAGNQSSKSAQVSATTEPAGSGGLIAVDANASRNTAQTMLTLPGPTFSTSVGNQLILAFVTGNPDAKGAATTVTSVSGGGLTWSLVVRSNAQAGTSEIWRAIAATKVTNASVQATFSQPVHGSIVVVSFAGVDTRKPVGSTAANSGASGAPRVTLTTTKAKSLVFGVGNDWDQAISRSLGPNQTAVHQYLTTTGDTFWVQRITNPITAAGTVTTLYNTAPTTNSFNLAAVEILPRIAEGDVTPPSTPSGLRATAVSTTQINLSWTASTDNVGVSGYQIYRNGTMIASVAGTSYQSGGLAPNTRYTYAVTAIDAAGNVSTISAPVQATTPATPPPSAAPLAVGTSAFQNTPVTISTLPGPVFSTTGSNELILLIVGANPKAKGLATSVTSVVGGGLTWTLAKRANSQAGTAEIWQAFATTKLTNASVQVTFSQPVHGTVGVVTFKGADPADPVGATAANGAARGAPTVSLVATRAKSLVFAVGNDWDTATARTLGTSQTLVHQYLTSTGDTFWVQRLNATIESAGATVTINNPAPATDSFNYAAVEVLAQP